MPNELTTAAVGLLGILIGFLLQERREKRRFLNDSRYEAYILFLKSLALTGASEPGSRERWSGVSGLIEAKSRIALFGSSDVVQQLSDFSGKHRRIDENNFGDLARVIALMRSDVGSSSINDLEVQLRGLLFEVGN